VRVWGLASGLALAVRPAGAAEAAALKGLRLRMTRGDLQGMSAAWSSPIMKARKEDEDAVALSAALVSTGI
jgi:hypothetical protein